MRMQLILRALNHRLHRLQGLQLGRGCSLMALDVLRVLHGPGVLRGRHGYGFGSVPNREPVAQQGHHLWGVNSPHHETKREKSCGMPLQHLCPGKRALPLPLRVNICIHIRGCMRAGTQWHWKHLRLLQSCRRATGNLRFMPIPQATRVLPTRVHARQINISVLWPHRNPLQLLDDVHKLTSRREQHRLIPLHATGQPQPTTIQHLLI